MGFSFAGFPCLDPHVLAEQCHEQHLPIGLWYGAANSYQCSLGCAPGLGSILLPRAAIDSLTNQAQINLAQTLIISDGGANPSVSLPSILLIDRTEATTPGTSGDQATAYACLIADRRWLFWNRGTPIEKAYNVRDQAGNYRQASLNSGTAWTWQQMVTDLWPYGGSSTLPFTPDGTPEGFWYHGITAAMALDHVLRRLACALIYNPIKDTFALVRAGLNTDATATNWTNAQQQNAGRRIWENYPVLISQYPGSIRTEFSVKPITDPPFTTLDNTVTPPTGIATSGSFMELEDDLTGLSDGNGSFTNLAALTSRATERTSDWTRVRQYFETGLGRVYSGIIDFTTSLGATLGQIAWEDRGGTEIFDGAKTTVAAGRFDLADWKRQPDYTQGAADVPVLPSSTTINANGYYPGNIWNRLTNTTSQACWLIAIGPAAQPGHLIFLKPYVGTPIGTHTDSKTIYAIWANEDLCRTEFDGDITTVQHYDSSKRQYATHDIGANSLGKPAWDWVTPVQEPTIPAQRVLVAQGNF